MVAKKKIDKMVEEMVVGKNRDSWDQEPSYISQITLLCKNE